MSANEDFFRERRAQAVFKHGILSRYPTVFAAKTGRGGRRVVFLDGYAGRGEYEDGSTGSPLLLAQTANDVKEFRDVVGIYVERNREDFANLERVMARDARPNDHLLCGDLQDHLPRILSIARGASLFAFFDPFGTALDRDQLVNQILCRPDRAPVEVLLHISVSTVARLGGLLRRRREKGSELSVADRKSIEHVDRFMGGDWWQQYFEPVRSAEEERATKAALRVAAEYRDGVCAAARCRAVSMPIRRHPGQQPKYVLVLFTRHPDGMWYFADSLGKAGREWEGAWRTEASNRNLARLAAKYPDPGLFGLEETMQSATEPFDPKEYERQNRADWESTVAGNVERLLRRTGPLVLAEHVTDVYGELLGAASERHVRAAIKQLHSAGLVEHTGVGREFFRDVIRARVT